MVMSCLFGSQLLLLQPDGLETFCLGDLLGCPSGIIELDGPAPLIEFPAFLVRKFRRNAVTVMDFALVIDPFIHPGRGHGAIQKGA